MKLLENKIIKSYFFNAKYEPINTNNIDRNNSMPGFSANIIHAKNTPNIG